MPAKPAKPDRYTVDRVGTPDPPSSQYFVLDVVNDWTAREALAYLGNKYRQQGRDQLAQECSQLLKETNEEHGRIMEARNPKKKKGQKKANAHP